MTSREIKDRFLGGILTDDEYNLLRDLGVYEEYVEGAITINEIYALLRGQAE